VWEVEFTDQFGEWWDTLTVSEQQSIDAAEMIPLADRLFDEHLAELEKE
jgi:hypothetical protein